ncbi:MAG: UvrD-helicase domain-containing protein, partial [Gammaproteobacteria bacterium]|nr:UvrD-helicase domain-containing protein [Gammaproteobacteria bacterium]
MTDSTAVALPVDHAERERALNPEESFIIQAPAGSGKTHLLIQRYLKLLTCVDQPEQIVAITFTVKAAGEMRERVLGALQRARQGVAPEAAHEVSMAELAAAAVARDAELGWDLENFPARLRVTTIDSLNRQLSSAAPLIAGGLSLNAISDDPVALYKAAANRLLGYMSDDSMPEFATSMRAVLMHLDNNVDRFESLVGQMLARREQWLPVLGSGNNIINARDELEACLVEIINSRLSFVEQRLSPGCKAMLPELLNFAAQSLAADNRPVTVAHWSDATDFPEPVAAELSRWQELASVLLTKGKTSAWRKTVNVSSGFPPKTAEKDTMLGIILGMSEEDVAGVLRESLHGLRSLPDPSIADVQWGMLEHLLQILPLAVFELGELFRERGEADFSEVSIEAQTALGCSDEPSDLALAMDCRLEHLLLDEFQDTSVSQYNLLKLLLRGWVPGDGRSLFLVGDPMQSIYRFRQAEVSNFLEVAEHGINTAEGYWFKPTALQLQANFRSDPAIVDWVNSAFSEILPEQDDVLTGAVSFSASVASKSASEGAAVAWHVMPDNSFDAEAQSVVELIEKIQAEDRIAGSNSSIGILVRSRRHASGIANLLRSKAIPFAGKDLEHMADIPLVQDLLSLTRSLLHPADRLAWTALLRAPWCGLNLEDLHSLLAADRKAGVWMLMNSAEKQAELSEDGRLRLVKLVATISAAFARRGRLPLCDWIEGVWLALGGPATAREANEMLAAEAYFRFLEAETDTDDIPDTAELLGKLEKQPVTFSSPDSAIQIMTVHKAKGLEFDVVILPSLGRTTRGSDKDVLAWKHVPRPNGQTGLLLAPIEKFGEDADPLFAFIRKIDEAQETAERARLLYVAVTRARKRLHLLVHLKADKKSQMAGPASNSLAYCMMSVISKVLPVPDEAEATVASNEPVWLQPDLRRFNPEWALPKPEKAVDCALKHAMDTPIEPITFDWAGPLARVVGTVVHSYLEHMALHGIDATSYSAATCKALLAEQGVPLSDLEKGAKRVVTALNAAVKDEKARWILATTHSAAESELPISFVIDGVVKRKEIDRTFISEE